MKGTGHRLVEIASLAILIILCLWLTLFAVFGNYFSIFLILSLILVFAAAKEPYRKGFIANCFIVGLFLLYPFEIRITRGDHVNMKAQPISYGKLAPGRYEQLEREGVVPGGCVVTPFSPQWRLLVIVP